MSNKNLIKIIISLSMMILSTITLVFAWFAINTEASSSGINVVAGNINVFDGYLNRYVANSTNQANTYTIGENVRDITDITEIQYNELGYDKVIYELVASVNGNSFSLELANTSEDRSSSITESTDNNGNKIYLNYLSNVARFYFLEKTESNGTSYFTITNFPDGDNYKNISYGSGLGSIDLLSDYSTSNNTVVSVYLLFDYSPDNIQKIYSDNLGTIGGENNIFFREDLEFRMI